MIRMLLAHPSRLICDSLRTALDNVEDVYVVGCATTSEELYFLLPHGNVVLLGVELEDATAFDLLEEIRITHPRTKVLILGVDEHPHMIIRYVEAGAAGYILQNESVEDMVQKLQAAYQEKAIISPSIAAAIMARLSHLANLEMPLALASARETQLNELTVREGEILELITTGCTNQEIAERLVIECGTVKNHVHNILKKLEVKSRHEAASLFQMQQPAMAVGD
ncbi:MAG: response regulator transcription factor [Anaerolineae bacterium]|nr:response regulator transcription factor [Anaerolineae bacterium]